MTNYRHRTSRRSFVLTVDTDMFEPELDEGCTVIIDPDRAFTVGSLVAVQGSHGEAPAKVDDRGSQPKG